jgi:hypothetical protein
MHAPAPAFAARNAVASRPLHLLLGPSVLRVVSFPPLVPDVLVILLPMART